MCLGLFELVSPEMDGRMDGWFFYRVFPLLPLRTLCPSFFFLMSYLPYTRDFYVHEFPLTRLNMTCGLNSLCPRVGKKLT